MGKGSWVEGFRQKELFIQWFNDEKSLVNKNREKIIVIVREVLRGSLRLIKEVGLDYEDFMY